MSIFDRARKPMVELPLPTGPYAVGRTAVDLVDTDRIDPYARRRGTPRAVTAWVWYPSTDATTAPRARYLPGLLQLNTLVFGIEGGRVATHARTDAPAATPLDDAGFPLVVLSPGGANPPQAYTALAEELASHGYVVAGVSHPHQVIPLSVTARGKPHWFRKAALGGALQMPGTRPFTIDLAERDALVSVNTDDLEFVARELLARAVTPWGRCNAGSWAAIGHSFGGASAVRACRAPDGAVAAVNLDGGLWEPVADVECDRPVLQLFAEHPEFVESIDDAMAAHHYTDPDYARADRTTTVDGWDTLYGAARPGYSAVVRGATHTSFSDWPMLPFTRWSPARRALGECRGDAVFRATAGAVRVFLEQHLQGRVVDTHAALAADPAFRVASPGALFGRTAPLEPVAAPMC